MVQPVLHLLRIVALLSAVLTLAACGVNERDPNRFEALAQSVASIPVSAEPREATPKAIASRGSVQRNSPLKVELMTPHELWDARDGLAAQVKTAALPKRAPARGDSELPIYVSPTPPQTAPRHIQLGAYGSDDGARSAWARMNAGRNGALLAGLLPEYEAVEVGGRRVVRLKVAASANQAAALCRDLAASDPWCARSGGAEARSSTGSF